MFIWTKNCQYKEKRQLHMLKIHLGYIEGPEGGVAIPFPTQLFAKIPVPVGFLLKIPVQFDKIPVSKN